MERVDVPRIERRRVVVVDLEHVPRPGERLASGPERHQRANEAVAAQLRPQDPVLEHDSVPGLRGRTAPGGAGSTTPNPYGGAAPRPVAFGRAGGHLGPPEADRVERRRSPPYGFGVVEAAPPGAVSATESGYGVVFENGVLRAELGRDGLVRSLVALGTGREALAGPGNVLQVYDDHPTAFDAWDVDPFHLETVADCPPATSCELRSTGPLRAEVAFERPVGRASTMRQVVRLDAGARRLEFHCEIDWCESHTMLKVLFPVGVRSPNATYQMQFGCTERPTHYSTSHDLARYEVPGHRFADLSEHGFGVALLTDCKYGYSTHGNEMRISLLRSPTEPDPQADVGRHEFAYAVFPHAGGWCDAGVVGEAARFETPLRWAPGGADPRSFFSVDDPNLMLDTVTGRGLRRARPPALRSARGPRHGAASRRRAVHQCSIVQPAGGSGRAARDGRRRHRHSVRPPRDRERAGRVSGAPRIGPRRDQQHRSPRLLQ